MPTLPTHLSVTVVVPARNEGARIVSCVNSIFFAARTADLKAQVIVVDDNSSDATALAAEAAGATVLRQPQRLGPLAARGAGLAVARSPWVVFVDGDCTVDRGALGALVLALSCPGVGVAAGRAVPLRGSSSASLTGRSARFSAGLLDQIKKRLSDHDFLPIGRLMAIRKEAWAVERMDQPHSDRVIAACAKAAGWTVAWVPEAKVYYQLPVSYVALRADWYRTRVSFRSPEFDSLPASAVLLATWAAMRHSPLDSLAWGACRAALVTERLARRPAVDHPASWDDQAGHQTVGSIGVQPDVKSE
jgi:glycosyltransferase involved in cell wall biosynthesis